MTDFSTGAELSLTVPDRELSAARSQIESELEDIEIGVDVALGDIGGAGGSGGGGSRQERRARRQFRWDRQRTEFAERQVELLENIADDVGEPGGGAAGLLDGVFDAGGSATQGGAAAALTGAAAALTKSAAALTGAAAALGGSSLVNSLRDAVGDGMRNETVRVEPTPVPLDDPVEVEVTVDDGDGLLPDPTDLIPDTDDLPSLPTPSLPSFSTPDTVPVEDPSPLEVDDPSPLEVEPVDAIPVEDPGPIDVNVTASGGGAGGGVGGGGGGGGGGSGRDPRGTMELIGDMGRAGTLGGLTGAAVGAGIGSFAGGVGAIPGAIAGTGAGVLSGWGSELADEGIRRTDLLGDSSGSQSGTDQSFPVSGDLGTAGTTQPTSGTSGQSGAPVADLSVSVDAGTTEVTVNTDVESVVSDAMRNLERERERMIEDVRNDLERQIDELEQRIQRGAGG